MGLLEIGKMYRIKNTTASDNPYGFPEGDAVFIVPVKDYRDFYLCERYDKNKQYLYMMGINTKDLLTKKLRMRPVDSDQSEFAIVQLTKDGDFVARYDTVEQAAAAGMRVDGIHNVLFGRTKSAYGFKWMYEKDWGGKK